MSTMGERKCALMLMSLHPADRRHLLGRLPAHSARSIRRLTRQLQAQTGLDAGLAGELLADEVNGISPARSLNLDQLLALSRLLPSSWFARLIGVWPGVDKSFLIGLLDRPRQTDVRAELNQLPAMPAKLVEALQGEALKLAATAAEAA